MNSNYYNLEITLVKTTMPVYLKSLIELLKDKKVIQEETFGILKSILDKMKRFPRDRCFKISIPSTYCFDDLENVIDFIEQCQDPAYYRGVLTLIEDLYDRIYSVHENSDKKKNNSKTKIFLKLIESRNLLVQKLSEIFIDDGQSLRRWQMTSKEIGALDKIMSEILGGHL